MAPSLTLALFLNWLHKQAWRAIPLAAANSFTAGPVFVAPRITWSSTTSRSVIGWTGGYGLSGNGFWEGNPPYYGLNDFSGTMTWAFDSPVSGAGGFINYAPLAGFDFGPTVIRVLDSSLAVLESYVLSISTPGGFNAGAFLAIDRSGDDISYFQLLNAYVVLRDFTVESDPSNGDPSNSVPEPMTLSLLGAGLAGICLARRRRA